MTDIILTGAKYLIIIFFAYFTYISFRAQRDVPDERKKASFLLQRITMLLIHALAFLSICINIQLYDSIEMKLGQAIGLYAGQLVYLIVMSWVIPSFVSLSKGLNNVMCMFLTIGFIIQTRLDFDTSLRQFIVIIVSSIVFLVCVFFCKRAKFMRDLTWIYAIVGLVLLATVLVLSRVVNGAKLAIDLGFFSFQPAEFVKILFVLFVASAFNKANTFKTVLITAACAAIHVLILVFCHDLGSALILFMIYMMMLYVATKKLLYVGIGFAGLVVGGFASYKLFHHVQVRISAWRDPWSTIDSSGYQIAQALFAIGTGGWFGSGLFGGAPKNIPMVSNDMIYAAISEELGGIFCILLILLCLCYVLMIFRVAIRVNNAFYKLLAFGLGSAYAFQVFLTIGGTIKFIPLTGVNLPFISSGGSSLLASLISVGMVQALYVISEADVERERQMVAAGVPLSEFEGYEPEKKRSNSKMRPDDDHIDYHEEPSGTRKRIVQMEPEEEYDYEPYEEHVSQKERISQMVPDEEYGYREQHVSQRSRISQMVPEDEFEDYEDNEYADELEDLESVRRSRKQHSSQKRRIRQLEDDDF